MTIYHNVKTCAYFVRLEDEDGEEEQDYPEDDEAAEQDTDADAKEDDQGISTSNERPFH